MRVHLAVPVLSFCWFNTALHFTCSSAALAYPTLIIAIASFDTKRATITHVYITLSLTAHICISYSRRGMPLPCASGTMYNLRITLHHLLCDNDTLALNCSSPCAVRLEYISPISTLYFQLQRSSGKCSVQNIGRYRAYCLFCTRLII